MRDLNQTIHKLCSLWFWILGWIYNASKGCTVQKHWTLLVCQPLINFRCFQF